MASVLAVCSISCSAMNRIAKLDNAAIVTMCEHAQSPKTNQEPRFFLARTDEAKQSAPLSPALPSLRRSAPAAAQAGRTAAAQAGRAAAAQAGRAAVGLNTPADGGAFAAVASHAAYPRAVATGLKGSGNPRWTATGCLDEAGDYPPARRPHPEAADIRPGMAPVFGPGRNDPLAHQG